MIENHEQNRVPFFNARHLVLLAVILAVGGVAAWSAFQLALAEAAESVVSL